LSNIKQTFVSSHIPGSSPVYLDCNATTPVEPAVQAIISRYFGEEFGNAGSRTHEYGLRANKAVQSAREQVGAVVGAKPEEVTFTSGATEANNLAILGLASHGEKSGRRHIISTAIEHKAVLEPLQALEARGFEVTLLRPDKSGAVDAAAVARALKPETLLVSVMQANNETGICQPLGAIAAALSGHDAFFHVDAAQGYGKDLESLRLERIDLISVSSHKIYGPVGVGSLVARRRGFRKPPLQPLTFGGGQERGLRPGTLPVPLIAGFGLAAEMAVSRNAQRRARCETVRFDALTALTPLGITLHGDAEMALPHVLNFSIDGLDSEAVMVALKGVAAVSNGSACTSQSYQPSHVLLAMGLTDAQVAGAIRVSWCHLTPDPNWPAIAARLRSLLD
jgi:cysteine desulfurase